MPITFKSKHAPDILMFESIALQLIKAMGYSGAVPGAVAAEDVSVALQRLEQKLSAPDALLENDEDAQTNEDLEQPVSIAHRALPLINMLKAAVEQTDYIIWE